MVCFQDAAEFTAAITLSRRIGVGARRFKELIDEHGSPSKALLTFEEQRGSRHTKSQSSRISRGKAAFSKRQLDDLQQLGPEVHAVYYGGLGYPWLLAQISEPPPYLFLKGSFFPLPPLAVAIVGARRCTSAGAELARNLAARLASLGVPIVSGGARGIDSAAHQGALEVGGQSILVTATGIDRVYPPENETIYQAIERQGCLVTELLPGTPPRRDFFPTRNRIIAGLSDLTVIIEGENRSGTASSANHTLRMQRQLFAWTGSPNPALRALPEHLLQRGCHELMSSDPSPLMKALKQPRNPDIAVHPGFRR